jgi:hypothetical protein
MLVICVALWCSFSQAQTVKTATIRMLDARNGSLIATSDFLIRVDHKEEFHGNWVQQNEDGTGKLILPPDASIVTAVAKYNATTDLYINCDSVRDKPDPIAHWYAVSEILTSGVVAPNGCSKHTAIAKPGEFVFFVRRRNWHEEMKDMDQ